MPRGPHRRIQPTAGYITARRAKRELGNISDGMLRSYVQRGEIEKRIPEGRSQGFYKLEDVRKIAARLKPYMPEHTVQFTRGTVDDLRECNRLLLIAFGGASTSPIDDRGEHIPANPIERRATWITKNPDVFYVLRVDQKMVGCAFILPLNQRKIQAILSNQITLPILADDIQPYAPGIPTHLYIMSVCVHAADSRIETKRFYGSRLINGILQAVVNLGKQGILLDTIVSRSDPKEAPDGVNFLKHMGFTEIETTTSSRNFIIRVGESGIPEVLKYKRAYAAWQAAQ
jgi:hypothetical protein